mmetsp:Transcript_16713/g.45004  ORF Transcript_16713/g.45004 Transcript_16713/m.45004 type:complete len:200 (+) Transcript_16713:770-1369(+)
MLQSTWNAATATKMPLGASGRAGAIRARPDPAKSTAITLARGGPAAATRLLASGATLLKTMPARMGASTTCRVVLDIPMASTATTAPVKAWVSAGVRAKARRLSSVTVVTESATLPRASSTATLAACAPGAAARRTSPATHSDGSARAWPKHRATGGLMSTWASKPNKMDLLPILKTRSKSSNLRLSAVQSIMVARAMV